MAGTILVQQESTVWSISATGGSASLPLTLCNYDLIPHRVRWEDPAATIGDQATIQDVQGYVVYNEIVTTTPYSPVEQRPTKHEKWLGYQSPAASPGPNTGITLTRLDSGVLYIYL